MFKLYGIRQAYSSANSSPIWAQIRALPFKLGSHVSLFFLDTRRELLMPEQFELIADKNVSTYED